jgi:putative NIF3 family GTP cyclohydrolase 1 type 2
VDAYISGEISERTYYQAKELGLDYFACGHHATERDGIKALGEHLAQHFGVEHAFIDSDNPI